MKTYWQVWFGVFVAILVPLMAASAGMANEPLEAGLAATFRVVGAKASGTGFLVSTGKDGEQVVLVTAAHVFEQMPEASCKLVLRAPGPDLFHERREWSMPIRDGERQLWKRHRELDVAVLPVDLPTDLAVEPFCLDQVIDASYVEAGRVQVGDEVFIPCFPAQLEANGGGWPILRKGSIASFPLAPVDRAKMIFVDCRSFGGESGAPVLQIRNGILHIVGLVHGMQRQTDRVTSPFEEKTMHTPLGLSIVVQAAYIREVIDLGDEKLTSR